MLYGVLLSSFPFASCGGLAGPYPRKGGGRDLDGEGQSLGEEAARLSWGRGRAEPGKESRALTVEGLFFNRETGPV